MLWLRGNNTKYRPPSAPRGKRAYVVGDVHGCLGLLQKLIEQICEDNAARRRKDTYIVFLGDIIDRGKDSRGVIEYLLKRAPENTSYVFIKGNHEDALLRGLNGEPEILPSWLSHGGYATVESYGIKPESLDDHNLYSVEQSIRIAIPKEHTDFLEKFVDTVSFGDYLMVHAGINPNIGIAEQEPRDLYWIRDAFLRYERPYDKIIVHGHTIVENIEVRSNRIGVDTGAYKTGRLSAICLDRDTVSALVSEGSSE